MAWSEYRTILSEDGMIITEQKKVKNKKLTSAQIIDCETWRIIRPATEEDNKKARRNIVERIKNAFWL